MAMNVGGWRGEGGWVFVGSLGEECRVEEVVM